MGWKNFAKDIHQRYSAKLPDEGYSSLIFSILTTWKQKKCFSTCFLTQRDAHTRVNNRYITNVLLKINHEVDYTWGLNLMLVIEHSPCNRYITPISKIIGDMVNRRMIPVSSYLDMFFFPGNLTSYTISEGTNDWLVLQSSV